MIRPESYHINVSEHIVGVKKGAIVNRGEVLAQSIVPGRGTLHAPEGGKVTRVDAFYLVITPSPKSASAIEPRFPDKKPPGPSSVFWMRWGWIPVSCDRQRPSL